jgi:hypothetical protein
LATDPAGLQTICDRFGPAMVGVFAERWCRGCRCRSPTPTAPQVMGGSCRCGRWRSRGPWYSTRRDATRRARRFFEALVAANLDIGRPEAIELIFRRGQRQGRPAAGEFKTKIVTYGTEVNVNAFYRHSRIKRYLKDGRARRINDQGRVTQTPASGPR